ncbi:hypothetical protein K469DRAFT_707977 [Zopfia rhizophila CBS 207.26]|uniref:Tc1-like transposase DDE domain-containing protein n=1 Tax=Zopfia rhizophila CBS 207.26 TaxID=1314779 RepID=A0A6A6E3V3_9PEZI|nr:hypothetical protein K469DRAFT_707977 [Zopfia rhizophila CBS 207.26]
MEWPSRSPDLNPIENTDAEVRQYLLEEWDKLDLDDFRKYVESMPDRCRAVIAANGGHTKW